MLLRARIVLPVNQPPVEDGAVLVSGNRILAVRPWSAFSAAERRDVTDLGEVILMPGLVNAHCHLDYTGMAGLIAPQKSFTTWVQAIVGLKGSWTNDDFTRSWTTGAEMLLRTGTTTVADVESVPELLPALWNNTPMRVISFRELISFKSGTQADEVVENAVDEWAGLPDASERAGFSPHAPYTTTGEILQAAAHQARKRRWRLMTHVAESEEEFEMFLYKHGPLYDWLRNQRDMSDCGLGSPIYHLERNDYLDENLLAVHVNYLWRDDAAVLARYNASVVHCPRSHAYFKHLLFPRAELAAAGVNICLGTDSLATVLKDKGKLPILDMFAEMRSFADRFSDVPAALIVKMATVNGAQALGKQGSIGEIAENALADLIALPYSGSVAKAYEGVLEHSANVSASMIDGNWALAPTQV